MTKYGKDYERERAKFKARCAAANEPCWICNNQRGPIDYTSRYERGMPQPLLFNLDHAEPVSLGGDPVRHANFRPAHYQRVQRVTWQHNPRPVPHLESLVSKPRIKRV